VAFVVAVTAVTGMRTLEKPRTSPRQSEGPQVSKGSARDTFVVGAMLSFPVASYIAGMDLLHKQHITTAVTVSAVLAFNMIMLMLLELPLLGHATRPDWTAGMVATFSDWLTRRGGRVALIGGGVMELS
jgi:hypothetical protein